MSHRTNDNTLRISGLDGLRGIAILAVLGHHLVEIYTSEESPLRSFSGGFLGVDLFFVISGFLITWLAIAEFKVTGSIKVRHFYLRRALRLIPALVFFLLVQMLVAVFSDQLRDYLPSVVATLFYYLNWKAYFTLEVAPGFGHLWSLSVEEQFYMVWPLFLLVLFRSGRPRIAVASLLAIALLVFATRNHLWRESGLWLGLYLRTDMHLDAFVMGALCACCWSNPSLSRFFSGGFARRVYFILFLMLTVILDAEQAAYYQWGAGAAALLACGIILSLNNAADGTLGIFTWPWLEYLGRRSYGIYLWHFPIFIWCVQLLDQAATPTVALIALGATALATEFSWRVVERPFNRRRARFSHQSDS